MSLVGTNGNSYGFGIEGSVNAAKGKSNSDSERWQNSHFTADKNHYEQVKKAA